MLYAKNVDNTINKEKEVNQNFSPCHWFKFSAYNSESIYGYGTIDEAESYLSILNKNREINHYIFFIVTDKDEIFELNKDGALGGNKGIDLHNEINERKNHGLQK